MLSEYLRLTTKQRHHKKIYTQIVQRNFGLQLLEGLGKRLYIAVFPYVFTLHLKSLKAKVVQLKTAKHFENTLR